MLKCFRNTAPEYLAELIQFDRKHNRNLWFNLKYMVQVPRSTNVQTSMSAISIVGPRLWNDLPVTVKVKENIKEFKAALKTHLFKESYN